ncbi:probable glutathione S-transferase [Cornus florida]|uniref:probable glutathione S-transferase n=1 Tax=Cornus florida TaxID=4283 RepID=UPI002896567B|nr:probable glutathione S-transferase [Cornus florida]
MGPEIVKVFGVWSSPFSHRVETALKLKGVQYEYIEEDFSNKTDLHLKYNPFHRKIPVLLHNGKRIVESLVILEYIDDTWKGTPIFPEDPYERAMARFWAKFIDDKFRPAVVKAYRSRDEEEQEKAIKEASELLKPLEEELERKEKMFFGGESIGVVDIVANFLGIWVGVIEEVMEVELLTKQKFPKLCKWIDEFTKLSVINQNLPPRDKLLALFQAGFQPLSASN